MCMATYIKYDIVFFISDLSIELSIIIVIWKNIFVKKIVIIKIIGLRRATGP